jgi:ATPase subunit of ABC transporter with duplicated ATPase domains
LSSGQRRRLALATALVRPRKLLVLDEPEARLDTAGVLWLAERLVEEKKAGTSILFASHDTALVDAVADETVALTPLP